MKKIILCILMFVVTLTIGFTFGTTRDKFPAIAGKRIVYDGDNAREVAQVILESREIREINFDPTTKMIELYDNDDKEYGYFQIGTVIVLTDRHICILPPSNRIIIFER